jgi:endoglucanase
MKKILSLAAGLLQAWWLLAQAPAVGLNQLGYEPTGIREAMIINAGTDSFYILAANKHDIVYRARLSDTRKSPLSALTARFADFSSINQPGNYWLSLPGVQEYWPLTIENAVYEPLSAASIKAFYFQRSDMELQPAYAGKWARPAGHKDRQVLVHTSAADKNRPAGSIIASPGGWYDAGDYNKYIVNSGITMGTLLSAYEDFAAYFDSLKLDIPESENGLPDLLDEVLYNLRWMMTMQDPSDGGVYHKCTNAAFDGMVMPGVTKEPRYVVQKSTAAALDFAATMAQASRVFRSFKSLLPGLSDSCIKAAVNAWNWAEENPNVLYEQEEMNKRFQPAISTGGYGDRQLGDERFWAAAELLITTGQTAHIPQLNKTISSIRTLPGWPQVGMLGIFTLLRHADRISDSSLISVARKQLLQLADSLVKARDKSLSATVMGARISDFVWGSNAVAANQGMVLINAYLQTKERKYLDGALSNLDYLLGKNATGYSFVTGIGIKTPMHPHHRPSYADKIEEPVPGLLAGGPNANAYRQDKCSYKYREAERQYSDEMCSFASNEIAINWNAPLVYLSGAICAIDK